jgi:class 3 adenylate cyclase/tetratricopeptide (TPR) repeat protein
MALQCLECGFLSPADARFCGGCGKSLTRICAACGSPNTSRANFCSQCGAGFASASLTPPSLGPRRSAIEHRQLTVLFCDLANSTALSQQLDPEAYGEVIRAYRLACVDAIVANGGHITRYLGDGLLVAFGYPRAREDDPRRAARASLDIAARVQAIAAETLGLREKLAVRIGINTGPVLAGHLEAGDAHEPDALVGETLNVAARLQSLASLNEVVVSDTTRRLIEDRFDLKPLGSHQLKGIEDALLVYRLVREKLHRPSVQPACPIVGRTQELADARARWRRVEEGAVHFLFLRGEAGIGKSRLIEEIGVLVHAAGCETMRAYCSAYTATSALHPFIDLLQRRCSILAEDDPEARWRKLQHALATDGLEPIDVARLGLLLDLPPSDEQWRDLAPSRRRQESFEGIVQWFKAAATRRPLLFVLEDLHWADESTLDVLDTIFVRSRNLRLMLVASARPDFRPAWPSHPRRLDMTLDRLSNTEVDQLVTALGNKDLDRSALDNISRRADGIPLFVNELTRSLKDQKNRTGPSSVPISLRDLLRSRIDGLTQAKVLLQYAAALGQLLSLTTLITVMGTASHDVRKDLDHLMRQGFIEDAGMGGGLRFHHALLRDEVYESTLRVDRRRLHAEIADAIIRAMPDVLERQPEVLATHLAEAGRASEAIAAWQRAGRRASERSANEEAVKHYHSALALLASYPAGMERDQVELALQVALGSQLIATRGNAAPEVEAAYTAAERLCARVQDNRLLFRAMRGLQTFAMVRGRIEWATDIGQRLIDIAREEGDPGMLMQAHRPMGLNLLYFGRYDEACTHLNRALDLYNAQSHANHRFEYGSDPAVLARCNAAWAHCLAGRPVTALAQANEAVAHARALDHPHSLAFALSFLASVQQCRNDIEATLIATGELSQVATEHVFPYWSSWADALGGWAQGCAGDTSGGALRLARALESYRQTGAELMRPYFLGLLAEIHLQAGLAREAIVDLEEAVGWARRMKVNFYLPELLRLQALARHADGASRDAIAQSITTALDAAGAQGSGWWKLRCLLAFKSLLRAPTREEAATLATSFPELATMTAFDDLLV